MGLGRDDWSIQRQVENDHSKPKRGRSQVGPSNDDHVDPQQFHPNPGPSCGVLGYFQNKHSWRRQS